MTTTAIEAPPTAVAVALMAAVGVASGLWAALPLWTAGVQAGAALPFVLCSEAAGIGRRPASVVKVLRSEPLVAAPGKRVTVVLVHYVPGAYTPRHVHGGDVTAYVLRGTVRSEHAGLPAADYHAGETFHEPFGTTHVFIENPSATEPAEILAITVHEEGAPLTTILD